MNVSIERLRYEHFDQPSRLTGSWLDPELFGMTIFSCCGYPAFARHTQRLPYEFRTHLFFGAYEGDRLAGFVEWRLMPGAMLLNNIYVSDEYRGAGIGRRLVAIGTALAQERGVDSLQLDVFSTNPATVSWYETLGFAQTGETHWYAGNNAYRDRESHAITFRVDGYPQAEIQQHAFGFSTFDVQTSAERHTVGRLGGRYFRVLSGPGGLSEELLSGLGRLDPERSLLVVARDRESRYPFLRYIASSIRMSRNERPGAHVQIHNVS